MFKNISKNCLQILLKMFKHISTTFLKIFKKFLKISKKYFKYFKKISKIFQKISRIFPKILKIFQNFQQQNSQIFQKNFKKILAVPDPALLGF